MTVNYYVYGEMPKRRSHENESSMNEEGGERENSLIHAIARDTSMVSELGPQKHKSSALISTQCSQMAPLFID